MPRRHFHEFNQAALTGAVYKKRRCLKCRRVFKSSGTFRCNRCIETEDSDSVMLTRMRQIRDYRRGQRVR